MPLRITAEQTKKITAALEKKIREKADQAYEQFREDHHITAAIYNQKKDVPRLVTDYAMDGATDEFIDSIALNHPNVFVSIALNHPNAFLSDDGFNEAIDEFVEDTLDDDSFQTWTERKFNYDEAYDASKEELLLALDNVPEISQVPDGFWEKQIDRHGFHDFDLVSFANDGEDGAERFVEEHFPDYRELAAE